MKKYRTCLISLDHNSLPEYSLQGRGWHVTLEKPKRTTHIKAGDDSEAEIVIHARSPETAQNAFDLIMASFVVARDAVPKLIGDFEVIPEDEFDIHAKERIGWSGGYWPYLVRDVALAARASHQRAHQYAMHKFYLSKASVSVADYALDPDLVQLQTRPSVM